MRKDENILELFFNEPTREWHFEELRKQAGISRPQLTLWLKKFIKEDIIKRHKPRQRMPHYTASHTPRYKTMKRLYALNRLEGFLGHLAGLDAQAIIIFGSFNRWDWHKESDIDLFILGDATGLAADEYRLKLGREIEVFHYKDEKSLNKLTPALLRNILEGYLVKGSLDFVEVTHA
jgi:predicted nucleotidyltransferase